MKYFIDTEFIEGKQDKTFLGIKCGETKPTIDLISIGIVSESIKYPMKERQIGASGFISDLVLREEFRQKEYYAISKDFNLKQAWKNEWVRVNVLLPIFEELYEKELSKRKQLNIEFMKESFNIKNFKYLINVYGKTNKQIAQEIIYFIHIGSVEDWHRINVPHLTAGTVTSSPDINESIKQYRPEFYGYYSDYDWVVFCQLFGTMMDLPKGFPMYCKDLKQYKNDIENYRDEKGFSLYKRIFNHNPKDELAGSEFPVNLEHHSSYPKQANEHNALSDAKWNYELYKFLNTL